MKETNLAAVRGLCAMLRYPDANMRIEAASACGRLGPLARASRKALTVATEDSRVSRSAGCSTGSGHPELAIRRRLAVNQRKEQQGSQTAPHETTDGRDRDRQSSSSRAMSR